MALGVSVGDPRGPLAAYRLAFGRGAVLAAKAHRGGVIEADDRLDSNRSGVLASANRRGRRERSSDRDRISVRTVGAARPATGVSRLVAVIARASSGMNRLMPTAAATALAVR